MKPLNGNHGKASINVTNWEDAVIYWHMQTILKKGNSRKVHHWIDFKVWLLITK